MKLQRKHVNTKSNLLDVLGQALHNFHVAWNDGSCSNILVETNPFTWTFSIAQSTVGVMGKHDTYADILELLWEYLPLMSLPFMTLLVSE